MPAHQRSHRLTSLYRERLRAISQRVEGAARAAWPDISELDASEWPDRMARVLTAAQTESVRATGGYLTAFVASETGVRPSVIAIDPRKYAGVTRDGRALVEALQSPLIGVRVKLKDGVSFTEALDYGLNRALRMVGFEVMQTGREALIDTVTADERFSDFQRAVAGTCGACEALSGTGGPRFEVHPNCECVPQPVIKGLRDRFPIPTGTALFAAKSPAEQDAAVGPDAAALIRDGKADLTDFVAHSPQELGPDYVTQKPAAEVG